MPSSKHQFQQPHRQEAYDLARRVEQAGRFPYQEWTRNATSQDDDSFIMPFISDTATTFCAIG